MIAQVLRKIPLINKMINWAERQRLKTVKQQRTYWTQWHNTGLSQNFCQSEDEQEQQGQPKLYRSSDHVARDDLDEPKGDAELKTAEP